LYFQKYKPLDKFYNPSIFVKKLNRIVVEKEGYYQSKFPNGKTGLAITILLDSDGEYPVYAELEGDILKKVWNRFLNYNQSIFVKKKVLDNFKKTVK